MKLLQATVIGTRTFQSKKNGKTYRLGYLTYESDDVVGLASAEAFLPDSVEVGCVVTGVRQFNGRFDILEDV